MCALELTSTAMKNQAMTGYTDKW